MDLTPAVPPIPTTFTLQGFMDTRLEISPKEFAQIARRNQRRGFIAGVIATMAWKAYVEHRLRVRRAIREEEN